jgi:hypothetical protein
MIVQLKHTDTEADALAFTGVYMWTFKSGTAAAPVGLEPSVINMAISHKNKINFAIAHKHKINLTIAEVG